MDIEQQASGAIQIVDWVNQARTGDRSAFHRLVDHFQPEIFRMIYYRTRSRMDAEDLTQDVFLKALKHIQNLEKPQLFRPWLFRIAVNRVRDYYRRMKIQSLLGMTSLDEEGFHESEEMAVAPEAAEYIKQRDFWDQVRGMLSKLSVMEREVFMLRFLDQLSIKEVAAAIRKNESTVKTHLYRALRKIKIATADAGGLWEGIQ